MPWSVFKFASLMVDVNFVVNIVYFSWYLLKKKSSLHFVSLMLHLPWFYRMKVFMSDVRISFWCSQIFWFGDLNYRVDLPDSEVRYLVAMKKWDDLLKSDQVWRLLFIAPQSTVWQFLKINWQLFTYISANEGANKWEYFCWLEGRLE